MSLTKYHAKRHFRNTPEPKGTPRRHTVGHSKKKLAFVVQEHHASRLHYDFRLELDGVLKSWAIPKGPSTDPEEHRLAVQVEDHPYEYRTFEGEIPEGNYGAGKVIVWDAGTYEPRAASDDPEAKLRQELKQGHLTFILHGQKLQGEFALVKMHGDDDKNWLLVKKNDEFANESDITAQDASIKSGRQVDEVGERPFTKPVGRYPKRARPWTVRPMLATLVDQPFDKAGWLFEIKWDGYRAIGSKHHDTVELYSRTGQDFTTSYVPVTEAIARLKHDVILDGEIVVTDEKGKPHFEWLQNWRRAPHGSLQYYAFDLLWYDGHDIRTMPLIERKTLLRSLIPPNSVIRYSDHIEEAGHVLLKEIQKQGVEGVVAKRADSPYREHTRGEDWLKVKTHARQEVVIGGFTEPRGSRKHLGSLLVGVYNRGAFVYVGHSGGGIADETRKDLRRKLEKLERTTSPFVHEPKPNAPVHWVRPQLVCEMSFSEWTADSLMRHPRFEGLRPDKKPTDVHRERSKQVPPLIPDDPKQPAVGTGDLPFTHLDKVFFPKHGYTKGDLIDYYRSVAAYMLPYLKDRPHSLLRQPDGLRGDAFFQKNMEHLPDWVPTIDIYSDSNKSNLHWLVGGRLETLLYMVQLGCIEINPWSSRVQHLDRPDWLVIDLDPEGIGFTSVTKVALEVKAVCDEWHIPSLPKTSGKTGIHVYIPLGAKYTYEQSKNFAHLLALEVNKRQPKITSVERMPDKRQGKIYLDFLQNREGQTLAAPYSVRPTADATVSMPLDWSEITTDLKPTDFTIQNALKRLQRTGDLWQPTLRKGIDLAKVLKQIEQ